MPRSTVPLTAAKVASLLRTGEPDKIPDGRSLYLVIKAPGIGQWKGQYLDHGRSRTKCLGSVADVKLADARSAWERVKADRRDGVTIPSAGTIRQARAVPTGAPYGEAVAEYVAGMAATWRGGATGKYAKLFAGDAKATMPDGRVLGVLTWPELTDDVIAAYVSKMSERDAKDTRTRLRRVRDYQQTGKLPTRAAKVEHHDAMPYKDVPEFYQSLDMTDECARALAFTILTGVRIGDVLGTKEKAPGTWSEIDGDVWNIPAERTKNGEPHSVPLTDTMLKLIGDRRDGRLFDVGYFKVNRYLKKLRPEDADIHGFRASLGTWLQEKGFEREASELVLQHKIGDATEQAYRRGDILTRRRNIMENWAAFVNGGKGHAALGQA
jgi:integrase